MYKIKEVYKSIQGEGFYTGRVAIFCRFSGCNLWSGKEEDRAMAQCRFCDTDFVGTDGKEGGNYKAEDLAIVFDRIWDNDNNSKFVVFTGGEPLLQLDQKLVNTIHDYGYEIAIETNGTIMPPNGIDWICVSPKAGTEILIREAEELKLVYPQIELLPEKFIDYKSKHLYLQPMDGSETIENTKLTIEYILKNPKWKLSIQLHKYLGIE